MANTIQGSFGLDLNPLRAAANRAATIGRRLGSTFARVTSGPLARIGATLVLAFGAAAFARGLKSAYALGDALGEMASRTGIGVKALFILRQQLQDSGIAADELGQLINTMQDSFSKKDGLKAIAALGLRFKDLQKLSPDEQFIAIGKAIASIGDPARRAQAAIDLFGRAGGKLITVFSDPDFGRGGDNLQKQAELLARNAEVFGRISDRLSRVGNVLRGFFLGVADRVSATLLPLLEKFETIDLVGTGQKFADAMQRAAEVFIGVFTNPGAALETFALMVQASLLSAAESFVERLLAGVAMVAAALSAGMITAITSALELIPGMGGKKPASFKDNYARYLQKNLESVPKVDFGSEAKMKLAQAGGQFVQASGRAAIDKFTAPEPGRAPEGSRFGKLSKFQTFSPPALGGGSLRAGLQGASLPHSLMSSASGLFDTSKIGDMSKAYGLHRKGDAARGKDNAKSAEVAAIEKVGQKMDDYWGSR